MSYVGLTRNGTSNNGTERKCCANCKYAKAVGKDLICGNSRLKLYACTVGKNVWCGKWEKR